MNLHVRNPNWQELMGVDWDSEVWCIVCSLWCYIALQASTEPKPSIGRARTVPCLMSLIHMKAIINKFGNTHNIMLLAWLSAVAKGGCNVCISDIIRLLDIDIWLSLVHLQTRPNSPRLCSNFVSCILQSKTVTSSSSSKVSAPWWKTNLSDQLWSLLYTGTQNHYICQLPLRCDGCLNQVLSSNIPKEHKQANEHFKQRTVCKIGKSDSRPSD